jgi:uncharacterized protein
MPRLLCVLACLLVMAPAAACADAGSVRTSEPSTTAVLAPVTVTPTVTGSPPATPTVVAPPPASVAALLEAARAGDHVAVGAQLAGGVDPSARDTAGWTALHFAAQGGHAQAAEVLLANGATVSAQDSRGDTPYAIAALARHAQLTGILLDAGADRIGTRAFGGTPLIAVAERGWVDVVREILRRPNIPVDHVNSLGWTALIEAIVLGSGGPEHTEIVRLLLAAGANPNLADGNGRSPRSLALDRGYREIAHLIEAAGGR